MNAANLLKLKQKRSEAKEKPGLKMCFQTLIDRKKLMLDSAQMTQILVSNLYINPEVLEDKVKKNVLMEMLVYYMKIWPGWSRSIEYFKGTLSYREWYESFQQYLIYKMYNIIKEEKKYREEAAKLVTANKVDASTFTEKSHYSVKPTAPYALCVHGQPNQLSNLIFMESENNIIMKQHDGRPWQQLTQKQLLNWPNVTVELRFQDISITRKNMHEFSRYLSFCGDVSPCPEAEFISHVVPSQENVAHSSYTARFIETYMKQFLKVFGSLPGVLKIRMNEIRTIFEEFMMDIIEANVCGGTVCTHTSVCFNIGKMKYIRNKKLVSNTAKGEMKGINFYETVIPKVEYTLEYFKDKQDMNAEDVSFSLLNSLATHYNSLASKELEKIIQFVNNSCISYSCNFCQTIFCQMNAKTRLLTHLQLEHTSEQPVLCFKCKKQFDIVSLAKDRWSHTCV